MNDPAPLDAILRQDFPMFQEQVFATCEPGTPFRGNWHYEHLCWALQRVARGEVRRLIINVPPRSGNSILASIAWPMFLLGHNPGKRIICISHTHDLARKFSVDRRRVARARWYQETFPAMRLLSARPRDMELVTTRQGSCFASGLGGAVLGRGADVIIIDDPITALAASSAAERRRVAESFDNELITRLNDKQSGAVVIVMQRLHEDDLVGHVLQRDQWEVISLPAIASEQAAYRLSDTPGDVHLRRAREVLHADREPAEVLEEVRRAQGSLTFQAQYQQDPVPPGGNMIKRKWLQYYEEDEIPSECDHLIASWDTASTLNENSDYSVGTVWGTNRETIYLLDLVRDRWESPQLRHKIIELDRFWGVQRTLIEDTELGRSLAQSIRQRTEIRPIVVPSRIDKEARLIGPAARIEAGNVRFPREAAFIASYVAELLAFPSGRHDDQVDSTSQALNYLASRMPRYDHGSRGTGRRNPERLNPEPRNPARRNP